MRMDNIEILIGQVTGNFPGYPFQEEVQENSVFEEKNIEGIHPILFDNRRLKWIRNSVNGNNKMVEIFGASYQVSDSLGLWAPVCIRVIERNM